MPKKKHKNPNGSSKHNSPHSKTKIHFPPQDPNFRYATPAVTPSCPTPIQPATTSAPPRRADADPTAYKSQSQLVIPQLQVHDYENICKKS